jgi:hypothetical protein
MATKPIWRTVVLANPTPGPGEPTTVLVTISTTCTTCGKPRGRPRSQMTEVSPGDWAPLDTWTNKCGHQDTAASVIAEEAAREAAKDDLPF